jgi:hypothetical protein
MEGNTLTQRYSKPQGKRKENSLFIYTVRGNLHYLATGEMLKQNEIQSLFNCIE